jgi:hypothetical protein
LFDATLILIVEVSGLRAAALEPWSDEAAWKNRASLVGDRSRGFLAIAWAHYRILSAAETLGKLDHLVSLAAMAVAVGADAAMTKNVVSLVPSDV